MRTTSRDQVKHVCKTANTMTGFGGLFIIPHLPSSNFAFWAWNSASVMAPESFAFCKSINCWPVVGWMSALFVPPPTCQEQPASKVMAEQTTSNGINIFFMGLCADDFLVFGALIFSG